MKFGFAILFVTARLTGLSVVVGFTSPLVVKHQSSYAPGLVALQSSTNDDNDQTKRMQELLNEDVNDPANMKAAAEAMKNIKADDLDRMVKEMDNMNPLQAGALKAMGMNPEMMKKTMEMMRDNPEMVSSAQKLMENMSPAELMEQSRLAQKRMATMTPDDLEETNKAINSIPKEQLDQAVEIMTEQQLQNKGEETNDDDVEVAAGPGSDEKDVIDVMFKVAELMSDSGTGGCTFAGFASLPVIQLLSGDREFDLSPSELKECWADGSLGATRVDRTGFERVWNEVQDYFEDDIMTEARKEAKKKFSKKVRSTPTSPSTPASTTTIGEGLNSNQIEEINSRVKNMSDNEVDMVLDQMNKMGPAEEARMKAMGVDPEMMKKTAEMMKNNPMMKKAAQTMMKNMSPEQMLQASKQAQQQMQGMSKEEMEKQMDQTKKDWDKLS